MKTRDYDNAEDLMDSKFWKRLSLLLVLLHCSGISSVFSQTANLISPIQLQRDIVVSNDTMTLTYTLTIGYLCNLVFQLNNGPPLYKLAPPYQAAITFTGLTPGTPYNLQASTILGTEQSDSQNVPFFTIPNQPNASCIPGESFIELVFYRTRGGVDQYSFSCHSTDGSACPNTCSGRITVDGQSAFYVTNCGVNVAGDVTYNFVLNSIASSVMSNSAYLTQCTNVITDPGPVTNVAVMFPQSDQVVVSWSPPVQPNGIITSYNIVYYPITNTNDLTYRTVNIDGSDLRQALSDCNITIDLTTVTAGQTYQMKIQAVNSAGAGQVKVFSISIPFQTTMSNYLPDRQLSSAGAIIGGCIGGFVGLCLLILAVVLIVVFVRRKGKFSFSAMIPESRKVALTGFSAHYSTMTADSNFLFSNDFEQLASAQLDCSTVAAELAVNRAKNRFTTMLPYDHNRVYLSAAEDEDGSDYINASWIMGYQSQREFVATQCPLPGTVDDFWRMVWECNSNAIVALVKSKAGSSKLEKCHPYLPEKTEPTVYGNIKVTRMENARIVTKEFVIARYAIERGGQSREVAHFQFLLWPEFGVPDSPSNLVEFVRAVRGKLGTIQSAPILVHCDGGSGPSGVYIALDHLLQHITNNDSVDVYGVLFEMRKNRMLMVATLEQYIFVHAALLEVISVDRENKKSVR